MPAARRPSSPARRTTSAATTASTASTSSPSCSARSRAPLPAVTPRLTREPRDDRAAHQAPAAVASEQVDAQWSLADRYVDARRVTRQLARLAHDVVAPRIGPLAQSELPGRHFRLDPPRELRPVT